MDKLPRLSALRPRTHLVRIRVAKRAASPSTTTEFGSSSSYEAGSLSTLHKVTPALNLAGGDNDMCSVFRFRRLGTLIV
jgi:hypothetical protein